MTRPLTCADRLPKQGDILTIGQVHWYVERMDENYYGLRFGLQWHLREVLRGDDLMDFEVHPFTIAGVEENPPKTPSKLRDETKQ